MIVLAIITLIFYVLIAFSPNPKTEAIPIPFWYPVADAMCTMFANTSRPIPSIMLWYLIYVSMFGSDYQ